MSALKKQAFELKSGKARPVWLAAGVLGVFLFAACGGSTATEAPAATGSGPDGQAAAEPADAAPDFELVLFGNDNHTKGEVLKLSDLRGRPVVVNFWFPSCPPCRVEMPDFEESFQKHGADVEYIGVQQLGLNSAEEGQDFILNEVPVNYAVGPDAGGIIRDYKVIGFPTTVFMDKDHRVVRAWTGALNAEKLEELVQELID